MARIVIITGNDLRHTFFRKFLASQKFITVVRSFCEENKFAGNSSTSSNTDNHLIARQQSERDFFELYVSATDDLSNPKSIAKDEINKEVNVAEVIALNPDLIISYGCSIIKSRLIEVFSGRFINVHLGLSPYYRGSGTNFFPFVNNELQYVGVTFMHLDAGVDTGKIIHQIRPQIYSNDDVHKIGNRLIIQMARVTAAIVEKFDQLVEMKQPALSESTFRYYRRKDFTEHTLVALQNNIKNGMIDSYLNNKTDVDSLAPIIQNPGL